MHSEIFPIVYKPGKGVIHAFYLRSSKLHQLCLLWLGTLLFTAGTKQPCPQQMPKMGRFSAKFRIHFLKIVLITHTVVNGLASAYSLNAFRAGMYSLVCQ